jgi:DNA-binding XRE family transcriptional regulator
MARAGLKWSIDDLAAAAGVARMTVIRFERGDTVEDKKVDDMRTAFERQRVKFVDRGSFAGAVQMGLKPSN